MSFNNAISFSFKLRIRHRKKYFQKNAEIWSDRFARQNTCFCSKVILITFEGSRAEQTFLSLKTAEMEKTNYYTKQKLNDQNRSQCFNCLTSGFVHLFFLYNSRFTWQSRGQWSDLTCWGCSSKCNLSLVPCWQFVIFCNQLRVLKWPFM